MDVRVKRSVALFVLCAVFVCLLSVTIGSAVVLLRQNAENKAMDRKIAGLRATVTNLERTIEDCHNMDDIRIRAAELGMQVAQGDSLRTVVLQRDASNSVHMAMADNVTPN